MSVTVRPARSEDVSDIRTVAEAAWWATYPGILDPDTIRNALDDLYEEAFLRRVIAERDDVLFLVAERAPEAGDGSTERGEGSTERGEGRMVVGFATAQETWADEVEIHTLYVHPDRWGEGTGTALLDAVAAVAREAGADRLRCEVMEGNHVGRAFLESRGFDHVESVTTDVGEETVPENAFEKTLE